MITESKTPGETHAVALTQHEMMVGSMIGCVRHIEAISAGKKPTHGSMKSAWQIHIEGALGEAAVAKYLGMYWGATVNTYKAADLGENLQVRTRSGHGYELIVRHGDSSDDIFVLATGDAPNYIVRGWITGKEAKQKRWLRMYGDRTESYFVPHEALYPMKTLPAIKPA